jgi:Alpha-L-rhamnosidase N-terminal domain
MEDTQMVTYIARMDNKIYRSLLSLLLAAAILLGMHALTIPVNAQNMIKVVSDTGVQVTAGNVPGASYPYSAVPAWKPYDPNNIHWDNMITGHTFSGGAAWVWESTRVQNPVNGDIVTFQKTFTVPGDATTGTLYITCDNAYEIEINGTTIGSAQLGAGWETSNLTEAYCQTSGWQTVETLNITSAIQAGQNTITIKGVNEYYGPLDGNANGTIDGNPGGLIFEMDIAYTPGSPIVGGEIIPVDPMRLIMPWLGAGICLMTAAGLVVIRHRQTLPI